MEGVAFHARHEFDHAVFADVLNEAVDDSVAELAMSHLAALEAEGGFHLVALLQEADSLVSARDVVVVVDGHGELDFLKGDNFLALARGTLAFFFFVEELAVILNAANGRDSGRRYLYQVQTPFAGNFEGLKWGEDTELLTLFIDYAHFAGADTIVDTDELLRRTLIDGFSPGRR